MATILLTHAPKSTLDFLARVATIPTMPINTNIYELVCSECPEAIEPGDEYIACGPSDYEEFYMHAWCAYGLTKEQWDAR